MVSKIRGFLYSFFNLQQLHTDIRTEILGGLTTFFTMAYIIIVNPAILAAAGIPKSASIVATCISAFFGTFLMGVYAKRPFAIAPYMGENAFIAYTVCGVLGYSWQTAIGAVFVGGVLFTILTVCKLRSWFSRAIPNSLKYSFVAGLGLFLCLIGLNETKIVMLGVPDAPLKFGNIHSPEVLLAVFTFVLISFLMVKKIRGALLLGIIISTVISIALGITKLPERLISSPESVENVFLKLDIAGALKWGFFSVILSLFVMDFIDTIGTLIGVGARANLLDKDGNLPDIDKPMLCDSLATCVGALFGTSTCGAYIESAAGIEDGARSGLSSVVVSLLFLLSIFLWPVFTKIPPASYGAALIIVGIFMIESIGKIDFSDFTESFPAMLVVILISFTYNMGIGITAGFLFYCVIKTLTGRFKELSSGVIILGLLSLLFYIFYPWH